MGPMFAFAQAPSGPIGDTLQFISDVINFLIPVLLAAAVLVFFWGLVKYIANASDEAAKESGKTLMIWGMVALFVMVAFWGIIGYVSQSLNLTGDITVATPPVLDPSVSPSPLYLNASGTASALPPPSPPAARPDTIAAPSALAVVRAHSPIPVAMQIAHAGRKASSALP